MDTGEQLIADCSGRKNYDLSLKADRCDLSLMNWLVETSWHILLLQFQYQYFGAPGKSSIKYASEMSLPKSATDIVMNCHALAPGNKPVEALQVRLTVGEYDKSVIVYGDRFWKRKSGFYIKTSPEPFIKKPVIYENAFGGTDPDAPQRTEIRNPVGCGIKNQKPAKLPNVEEPAKLIHGRSQRPEPAGFGYIAPDWAQRAQYAGTYDETWQKERAPFLPEDFNPRFFNAAHPDLITRSFLKGGENVLLINTSPNGPVSYTLPGINFDFVFHIAGQKTVVRPVMDTLIIEPDHDRFSMIWRACTTCDKKVLQVDTLEIHASSSDVVL